MLLEESLSLPAAYVLREVGEVECLRSTSAAIADTGVEEGTLLVASNLSAAEGYQHKQWQGFSENLHFSLILQPEFPAERFHEILILGVVSLGASLATHVAPMTSLTYRWPNDVYIAGQKVASVWLDKGKSAEGPWLTLTVSVNLMHAPGDDDGDFSLATMSVREAEGNSDITRELLLETWARQFITEINNWDERGFDHILAFWKTRSEKKELSNILLLDGSEISGSQTGVYEDAACMIKMDTGESVDLSLPQYLHWI